MINNPSFRRSAKCGRFDAMLSGRDVKSFPIETITGKNLTQSWIDSDGLEKPVLIENAAGLGLKLPASTTKLSDIADIIGHKFPINVIAVGEQSEVAANIGDFAFYLANRSADHKILNLISLEISATRLSNKVQSPSLVREVDWIDKCWPLDRRARGDFPQVQKYCLCGMAGSYTDFHVDFGGTSVWYHVVSGQKRFYLIPPTTKNLKLYESWTCSKSQDSVFFGDIVGSENCFQFDLFAGQTLLIPGAWIHAVYTPLDSLVFGGNFLHSFNIIRQLQVYGIEQRTFVAKSYCFPYFKLINWFVLCSLLPLAKKLLVKKNNGNENNGNENNGNGSDSDEESEDLISLCNSIKKLHVFKQFPYLVRTCHIWLLSANSEEHSSFTKAAQECWCDDGLDLINSWWIILFNLADQLSTEITNNENEKLNEKLFLRRHVQRVKNLKNFDLMDDNVIGPAFGENSCFDEETDFENENGFRNGDDTVIPVNSSNKINVIKSQEDMAAKKEAERQIMLKNMEEKVNERMREKAKFTLKENVTEDKPLGGSRIILKLGGRNDLNEVNEEEDNEENEENREEEEDGEEEEENEDRNEDEDDAVSENENESSFAFKIQLPTKSIRQSPVHNSTNSSVRSNSTDNSSSTKFNISIATTSSGFSTQAMLLKNRMAQQTERMKTVRTGAISGKSSGLILNTKKIGVVIPKNEKNVNAMKRKVRRIDEYEDYEKESENENRAEAAASIVSHEFDEANILPVREGLGGGRYGTRGKRVSAEFLLHA